MKDICIFLENMKNNRAARVKKDIRLRKKYQREKKRQRETEIDRERQGKTGKDREVYK